MSDALTGKKNRSITSWNIGEGAVVYPHLVTNKYSTTDEMNETIKQIAKMYPELDITIYEQSTFTYELKQSQYI